MRLASWRPAVACRIYVVARGRRLLGVPVPFWVSVRSTGKRTLKVRVWASPLRITLAVLQVLAWLSDRIPIPFDLEVEVPSSAVEAEPG